MDDLQNIVSLMRGARKRLYDSGDKVFKLAEEAAETERDYKMALRQEILKLRTDGFPATLITDLAKGEPHIADLRFKRDVAKETYKSARDYMNNTRTESSLLQSILRQQNDM